MKSHAPLPIRILTHNIRYATTSPFPGEKPWADRKPLIIAQLKFLTSHNPESFICLQEVLHEQLTDILAGLNATHTSPSTALDHSPHSDAANEWSHIGVGRDDGAQSGEYSPILFRPRVWQLTSFRTVWLSPTPDRPSKGWDAASIRIVTVGSFVHRASRRRVVGLCTHFDEQGSVSRRESAEMIKGLVKREGEGDAGVWVAGDLNSEMDEDAYRIISGEGSGLSDARDLARWRWGEEKTFTGFGDEGDEGAVIDYVFVGEGWRVEGASVVPNRFDEGVYCSDHRAVVMDAVLGV